MWADKYKPQRLSDMCYPAGANKLKVWLENFKPNTEQHKNNNSFRAALLSGPPGIGKTTSVYMVAKELGLLIVEYNASDFRSKKSLKEKVSSSVNNKTFSNSASHYVNMLLLMEEVDGCDIGGTGEIINMIKKTTVPIVCTCNDRYVPKLKSLANYCEDIKFSRPPCNVVANYLYEHVLLHEGVQLNKTLLKDVVKRSGSDIRSMLNNLQLWSVNENNNNNNVKLSETQLASSALSSEKDSSYGLFDSAEFFLMQGVHGSGDTNYKYPSLNEYYTVYYNSDLIDMFVQENYLRFNPAKLSSNQSLFSNNNNNAESFYLERTAQSAASISRADAAHRIMYQQQDWSVSKFYVLHSSIAPCIFNKGRYESFVTNPAQAHFDRQRPVKFPSLLGQNSTGNKNKRLAKLLLIQGSGVTLQQNSKNENNNNIENNKNNSKSGLGFTGGVEDLVCDYIPLTIVQKLTAPFVEFNNNNNNENEKNNKEECIAEVIDFMDVYHLQRDDWDFVQDVTQFKKFNHNNNKLVIPAALKSAFTREFNKTHKNESFKNALKGISSGSVDDNNNNNEEEEVDEIEEERKKLLALQKNKQTVKKRK
ncbi:replication factor C subunit 1 [Angomonas deanei]|uniref:Rad17 P-loop domain/ATPase family associated with various cellular activities (AAA)/Replication factor RFC1 C terminal domain containing protein, putative n=1 Tax=Angomonas deanei TaxID=59799 RepID=A0A7G2CJ70_9TRYP|nr:replication factor C subunit 1 [Angomonas deanei]CAD2219890.1 Rad17 P-loop domain/ATPase family associated with various cellular activities (AAA)/Replication factor RFC1 C terminal domain containing protein, putative [Angomonas deanei]|eukprot:EPY29145.1 replication factor C subunit 1 [Angomonas deanei]